MSNLENFITKIENNAVKVGIIGLGYVGLPLALSFARKGIEVIGFEKAAKRPMQSIPAGTISAIYRTRSLPRRYE